MSDLATLAQVIAYMGGVNNAPQPAAYPILSSLITAYSKKLETLTGRIFDQKTYNEWRNGSGNAGLVLIYGPVSSIVSVSVGQHSYAPAGNNTNTVGWRNTDLAERGDGRNLFLQGGLFWKGKGNVLVVYTAGYPPIPVTGELWNIPASPGPYTITLAKALSYIAGSDSFVYTSGGAPLTRVAGNPNVGQYSISALGVATFNAGDAGVAVTAAYSTLGYPADLTQALVEWTALAYARRNWIGYQSKTLATEVVSFVQADMTPSIKSIVAAYSPPFIPGP